MGTWLIFDDETVDLIKECDIPKYFGDSNSGSAYVLYYQAVDIALSALGLRPPSPEPVMQPLPQSESPHDWQLTDSPEIAAQSIPPLPPGLTDDLPSATPVPEALPRPTTPIQLPSEPSPKPPRKVSSQFLRVTLGRPGTVGHGSSRNDAVLHPSRSVLDEKFNSVPKPPLLPIATFPKEDLKPLDGHSASAVNGKGRDSDKSMMGWLRRRSFRNVKSRPSSEVNTDIPPLSQGILAAPGSPVRNQSTSSSSNSSKDSRRPLDSPTPAHPFPHVSPLANGKLPPPSRAADASSCETDFKKSSTSASSYTAPTSPSRGQSSQARPLPPIPASPQTLNVKTPPSSYSGTSLDHSRVSRRHATSPSNDSDSPTRSPKLAGRPATSAGAVTKAHPPPLDAPPSGGLRTRGPNNATSRSNSNNNTAPERPKSAHASYGVVLPPSATQIPPLPPVPLKETGTTRKTATRKLSFSAPMLGFGRRDKDKH